MSPSRLIEGRVAVVTGAGRGIGRATALLMAREGARVVVNDHGVSLDGREPSSELAQQVAAEITAAGGEAVASADTVATASGACRVVECGLDSFGALDILVNGAGTLVRKLMVETDEDDWDRQVDVHLKGAFLCIRAAAPHMVRRRYGRIISFTSRAGIVGTPGLSAYGAAKAGLIGLSLVSARELAAYGITVNLISPLADTRMNRGDVPPPIHDLLVAQGFAAPAPAAEALPGPEPVAAVAVYLASDEAANVTGQIVGIAGDHLQLWSPPRLLRSAFMPGGWSIESLRRHFAGTVGQGLDGSLPRP